MSVALTESVDVAQVALYAFWAFFFGLIFWLRREDRREGYPLESDAAGLLGAVNPIFIPPPKTFLLPHGGEVQAPNFARDARELLAERTSGGSGVPLQPVGEPMLSGVGPAAFAERADTPELTREGHDLIVPMRIAEGFSLSAGPDPRGWSVVAADGKIAGVVKDLWVDRADIMVRYIELELASEGAEAARRLLPITMLRLLSEKQQVEVAAVQASHFDNVPVLKHPERITLLEEERICAYFAGGRLYAEPKRLGPVL